MDWMDLATGFALGALAGSLFFAGLAISIRIASRSDRAGSLLLMSAGLRVAILMIIGWHVAQIGEWSLAGFVASFLLVRFAAIAWVRPVDIQGGA